MASTADLRRRIRTATDSVNKGAKYKLLVDPDEAPNPYFLRRPCGVTQLDIDTGGGLPAGGLCYISGPDNCLSGSTLIHHEVRTANGTHVAHKWVTLERLYERFHRIILEERKGRSRLVDDGCTFHAPSMTNELCIVRNKIIDVVRAGEKECLEIITESGQRIEATAEHKFFDGQQYTPLKDLKEGDFVYIHTDKNYPKLIAAPETITSIEPIGVKMTYDVKMDAPYHNFIANNFVVHNSGKTWLLYNYFAMHQRLYGEEASIVYGTVEGPPNHKRMREVGCIVPYPDSMLVEIDIDRSNRRLPLLTKAEKTELKRKVGTFKILRAHTSEELLDSLLTIYASNAFHIIALDSISATQSSAEAGLDTLGDNPQQAANASLLTRFMQHYHPLTQGLTKELVTSTMIFTAQVRANRHKSELPSYMAKWQKDWATTGGANAMKHGKLIDVQIWSEGKDTEGSKKVVVGKTIKWNLVKGSAGTSDNKSGEYPYRYDSPGDHTLSLINTGIQYGVAIEQEGKVTFIDKATGEPLPSTNGTTLVGIDGIQGLRNLIATDPAVEFIIRREILSAAGIGTCLYRLP